eukprot:m.13373 g.13373  ORF g.13373 m.13373 type:complete len:82 (-) comp4148_c0_seq1:94-339(-)
MNKREELSGWTICAMNWLLDDCQRNTNTLCWTSCVKEDRKKYISLTFSNTSLSLLKSMTPSTAILLKQQETSSLFIFIKPT